MRSGQAPGIHRIAPSKNRNDIPRLMPISPPYLKALIAQLLRLLDGIRDDSLWQAPDLDYDDAGFADRIPGFPGTLGLIPEAHRASSS